MSISGTRVVLRNDSLISFLSVLKKRWGQQHYSQASQREEGRSWVLFRTYEEWDNVVLAGKSSDLFEELLKTVELELRTLRILFRYDEGNSRLYRDGMDTCGYAVDVGRFLEGEPECFWATNKPVNELIDIYITGAIHSWVRAEQKAEDVARIAKLVYLLKLKGCNARIFFCDVATYGACRVLIKDYRQWLDLRTLLLVLLPDFQRRYLFQLYELDPAIEDTYGRTSEDMWSIWRDEFNKSVLSVDLLRADMSGVTDDLLKQVAKERDIKKIVEMIQKRD